MASVIKLVEESAVGGNGTLPAIGGEWPAPKEPPVAPPPAPSEPSPQIIAAFQAINGRLQAVESAVQGVPKAVGLMRVLLAALGARALVSIALLACFGLAAQAALHPSWEAFATFGAFAVLVYLPVAALAYFRGN
jgi:hypothetical protein